MDCQSYSDISPIAGLAFKRIQDETERDLSHWKGPFVTLDGSEYKLEWRPPEDQEEGSADAVLTLYKDGVWDLYAEDGSAHNGKMMVLHDKRWIKTYVDAGGIAALGKSSWMYFRSLADGKPL